MKSITLLLLTAGAVAVSVYALAALAGSSEAPRVVDAPTTDQQLTSIERGRYLVHQVGLCIDCHSPRDGKGRWIPELHLTGSPLPFKPAEPMPWMSVAPKIAGLPAGYTEEQTVHFLMTGERPNGLPPPLPPMPEYRLNQPDAQAVSAYLRSLGSSDE